jgi:hypothetical protein
LHSTEEQFSRLWRKLAELGCSYEQANATLLAVDVPTHVDIYAAYTVLEAGAHEGIWEFEEGHCGHPLRS